MRRLAPLAVLAAALALTACGKDDTPAGRPALGAHGDKPEAAQFSQFATKNTTRIGGADAVAQAAAVARAVFPGATGDTRPSAVTLVGQRDWRVALAASVLMARPLRAPLLFSDGTKLPEASQAALDALGPRGAPDAGGAQVLRIGDVARPKGLKATDVAGRNPFELAAGIDRLAASARGAASDRVMIVSADTPAFALPAASWAAKSGDPILFVTKHGVPAATRAALRRHEQPKIYVVGPSTVIGPAVLNQLRRLGKVKRIEGPDAVRNSIAFARYLDGDFGWGIVDPGHGLVFVNQRQPLAAAAAAPLSAAGKYGPLLLLDRPQEISRPLSGYLLDIQPGYRKDPVRGVYNHGWVIGDERAVSIAAQARIDALLEITPVERTDATS